LIIATIGAVVIATVASVVALQRKTIHS